MTTPPCQTYVIEALEYAEGKTVTLYGVHLYGTVVYGATGGGGAVSIQPIQGAVRL